MYGLFWRIGAAALEKAHIALTNYLRKRQPKALPLEIQKTQQEDYHSVKNVEIFIDTALLKSYLKTNSDQRNIFLLFFFFWIDFVYCFNI
jgi:hypothetical protein